MDFEPYFGWIEVPDPENPPPGAKLVSAADLLRYEQGLADTEAEFDGLPNRFAAKTHNHPATQITSGTLDVARLPVATSGESSTTQVVRADDSRLSDARPPTAHQHAASAINSGTLGIARLPVAASGQSSTTQVVRADDSRLSDARTPTSHSHGQGDVDGLEDSLAGKADAGAVMLVVNHGADAAVARPTGAAAVYWIGTVVPTNGAAHDLYLNTGTMALTPVGAA